MIISDSFTNSLFANICFIISEFPTNIYLTGCFFIRVILIPCNALNVIARSKATWQSPGRATAL